MTATLCIFTKDPIPGRVKTRLIPVLGAEGAAQLHAQMVAHTLQLVEGLGLPVEVWLDGNLKGGFAKSLGHEVIAQGGGDLGARMHRALGRPGRQVALGTDAPLVQPAWIRQAAQSQDVALGPTEDGGYWTIAVTGDAGFLFTDMPWSTPEVFPETRRRLKEKDRTAHIISQTYDIDVPRDLERLFNDPRCPAAFRQWSAH